MEEGDEERTANLLHEVPPDLIDSVGPEGDMLLHLACLYGHEQCVRLLLQHNASTAVLDEDNGTVLHDAAATGCAPGLQRECNYPAWQAATSLHGSACPLLRRALMRIHCNTQ